MCNLSAIFRQWADAFPDQRAWLEIASSIIFASEFAAGFTINHLQRNCRYSVHQLLANTQLGGRLVNRIRQALSFEQMKTRRTHVIVDAGEYFEIFATLAFEHLGLALYPRGENPFAYYLEQPRPRLLNRD
jgi:hypothetical protein